MRALFGALSLLVVLAVVGLLVKKQLAGPTVIATPAGLSAPSPAASSPPETVQQQSQQIQQQYKQAVDAAMQQPRPMPEDAKSE